jgi:glycosyltransferase involved in cell wall biosynthesis
MGMTLYGWHMFLGTLPTLKRLQRTFDFTVIDAHYLYPDAFAAILLGKVLQKPVIVSARGTDVHLFAQLRSLRPFLRFVLRHAAAVITVCQALHDRVVQLGAPEEKSCVIGNGIDVTHFYPTDPLAARRRLGLPLNTTLLLSVAKLAEVKGIHHLIEAVVRLRRQTPELLLVLVSNTSDGAYERRLQAQVAQSQLTDVVRFVGPQPHTALRDWYNACDLFCLGSVREGWPNVLLEALACGKPVVASRVGGIPEVICSPEYGILVDPPTGSGFAAALQTALHKRWDTEKLVHYARQQSWEQVSAKLERLFEDVNGH